MTDRRRGYGGYDLYTNAGVYDYAPDSLVELQQLVNAHKPSIGGSGLGRVVDASRYAGRPPWRGWEAMYRAEPHASAAQIRRELSTLPPGAPLLRAAPVSPAQARLSIDSLDYIDSTEALAIGAGRADVRAGAMEVLSTLKGVRERVPASTGFAHCASPIRTRSAVASSPTRRRRSGSTPKPESRSRSRTARPRLRGSSSCKSIPITSPSVSPRDELR